MVPSRWSRSLRSVASTVVALCLLAGPLAMTLRHALGMAEMPAGMAMEHRGPAGHHSGQPVHDPLAACCDLCAVGCTSAPHFDSAAIPLPALASPVPTPAPAILAPIAAPLASLLPPSIGPPRSDLIIVVRL